MKCRLLNLAQEIEIDRCVCGGGAGAGGLEAWVTLDDVEDTCV